MCKYDIPMEGLYDYTTRSDVEIIGCLIRCCFIREIYSHDITLFIV